jgi:DNA-binding NarL/FixJ family response regulator
MGVEAIKHGALGYICKDQVAQKLQEAIIRVSQGRRYISQEVADGLMEAFKPKRLSEREIAVLKGIGCGKSTKEIAKELGISDKTVSTYRERIQHKTGATRGTNDLIKYAIESEKKCPK